MTREEQQALIAKLREARCLLPVNHTIGLVFAVGIVAGFPIELPQEATEEPPKAWADARREMLDGWKKDEPENMPAPPLLRIPQSFHTVEEVLETAKHLDLPNVMVLAEYEDGRLVYLQTEMGMASANYLLDRTKMLLLPQTFEKREKL